MIINNYIKFTSFLFHILARHRLGTIKNIPYPINNGGVSFHSSNPSLKSNEIQ
jgi:hypothetical protein